MIFEKNQKNPKNPKTLVFFFQFFHFFRFFFKNYFFIFSFCFQCSLQTVITSSFFFPSPLFGG